jgi:ABC-2 type transport system ATP-binding protein
MLDVVDLRKAFGDVVALDGVTFSLEPGSLTGFLGPNGAGKTTTMRAVLGLLRPDAGEVRWKGTPVTADVRKRFGYMPEERGLYPRMPVLEQIAYFAQLAGLGRTEADAAAARWLDRLGLADRQGDDVDGLSHGNQQRVQLAVALVHDPDLLVLDEPFSGLDPLAAVTMQELLVERSDVGVPVLFSSHQLDMVEELCRQVVIVDGGTVVAAGPVDDLRAAEPVRDLVVGFEGEVADASWVDDLPGARLVRATAEAHHLEVPADLDLAAALDRAARLGTVRRFSFEPPDLSVVFRNAVERAGTPG